MCGEQCEYGWENKYQPVQSPDTYCSNLVLIQWGHSYQTEMLLPKSWLLLFWLCSHSRELQQQTGHPGCWLGYFHSGSAGESTGSCRFSCPDSIMYQLSNLGKVSQYLQGVIYLICKIGAIWIHAQLLRAGAQSLTPLFPSWETQASFLTSLDPSFLICN